MKLQASGILIKLQASEICQNPQKNTCANKVVLIKLQASEICQNPQKNTCTRVPYFNKVAGPCEFWQISKNTIYYRKPLVAASGPRYASGFPLSLENFSEQLFCRISPGGYFCIVWI